HLATAVLARHPGEARRAVEADGDMAERGECRQVAPRPAAEVEDGEGRLALEVAQQLGDVLADVVVARALPEGVGTLLVVGERGGAGRAGRGIGGRHDRIVARRASSCPAFGACLEVVPRGRIPWAAGVLPVYTSASTDPEPSEHPMREQLPVWIQQWLGVIVPAGQVMLVLLVAVVLRRLSRLLVDGLVARYGLPQTFGFAARRLCAFVIFGAALLLVLERLGVSGTV